MDKYAKKDAEKIRGCSMKQIDNYIIVHTSVNKYRLSKKDMRGEKVGHFVSCIDLSAKEGEQEAFFKRIKNNKDAKKYFNILTSYVKLFGKDGLMKVWEESDKSFDYKICLNKDYVIPHNAVKQYAIGVYDKWQKWKGSREK